MIWISDEWKDDEVLDSTDGERLERWASTFWYGPTPR